MDGCLLCGCDDGWAFHLKKKYHSKLEYVKKCGSNLKHISSKMVILCSTFDSNIYLIHLNDPIFYFGPHRNHERGYENDHKKYINSGCDFTHHEFCAPYLFLSCRNGCDFVLRIFVASEPSNRRGEETSCIPLWDESKNLITGI